jgi:hypothetical protein
MNKNAILGKLSESDPILTREGFATQPVPHKVFSSIWALEAEVNNGGFSQYFHNSSAETASFVISALEIIGASSAADICKRAINCAFPAGLPADPDAIQEASLAFTDEVLDGLDQLDREFYTYPDNLTDLLFAYVVKHPGEFGELSES